MILGGPSLDSRSALLMTRPPSRVSSAPPQQPPSRLFLALSSSVCNTSLLSIRPDSPPSIRPAGGCTEALPSAATSCERKPIRSGCVKETKLGEVAPSCGLPACTYAGRRTVQRQGGRTQPDAGAEAGCSVLSVLVSFGSRELKIKHFNKKKMHQ